MTWRPEVVLLDADGNGRVNVCRDLPTVFRPDDEAATSFRVRGESWVAP